MDSINPGVVVVVFADGVDKDTAQAVLAEYGLGADRWATHDIAAKVLVPEGDEYFWCVRLNADPRVFGADPSYLGRGPSDKEADA